MEEFVVEPSTKFISYDVAQKIWDCAADIVNQHIEGLADEELAFYNGIFFYSVYPLLCNVSLRTEVLDMLRYPFCFVTGWSERDRRPLAFEASVWETFKAVDAAHPDPFTLNGARAILSSKSAVLGGGSCAAGDCLCSRYIQSARDLNAEVQKLFEQRSQYFGNVIARVPDQGKEKKHRVRTSSSQPAKQSQLNSEVPKKKLPPKWVFVLLIGVCALTIAFGMPLYGGKSTTSSHLSQTELPSEPETTEWIPPVRTPYQNGRVINYPETEMCAPLRINTSGDGYYFFVLSKPGRHKRYMTFFGWAGETVEVDAPLGTYELYYAHGNTWYGTIYLFGNETSYGKCDGVLNFTEEDDGYSGYEITLYPVHGGNLETSSVLPSEFPT